MNEVFKETILNGSIDVSPGAPYPANNLNNPWEITYGSDGFLWITEAKGYKVRRMDPVTGVSTTVLDLSPGITGYLTAGEHTLYNRGVFSNTGTVPWPQGGMMGLALHPDFMNTVSAKKYVYIGYVQTQGSTPTNNTGQFYTNSLVRFTYNTVSGLLENPVAICDTLPGSKDHNSGRMIIAPVGGVNYLFYAEGDMGAGQYENLTRTQNAQKLSSYEGKVLRFNLEEDADAVQNIGVRSANYDRWIPNSNPFNATLGVQSAVYTLGVRNNQGFAYNPATNKLYGAEHGQFSDDEINIIEMGKNYGHPLVEGYNDGNYNNAKAGSSSGSNPLIISEATNVTSVIGVANYRDPLYTYFPAPNGPAATANTILNIYQSTTGNPGGNGTWHSVAHSGMDIYTSSFIPGWQNSLFTAAMKWARFFRLKLNATGDLVVPTPAGSPSPTNDTVALFWAQNRYRDLAFSPDGKSIFAAIDLDQTTSGPTAGSPQPSECPGCIKKWDFLGYNDNAGLSSIPTSIPIAPGLSNQLTFGTPTAISSSDNNDLWVPITDSLGNIIAEIDANGNNLGNITSSLYKNTIAIRYTSGGTPYLDRSLTISVQNQPSTAVSVRLYITAAELAALVSASPSVTINNLKIYKNNDANGISLGALPISISPVAVSKSFGTDYVLTVSITSFSTFYFAGSGFVLPVDILSLSGKYADQSVTLDWKTASENNSAYFIVEKSSNGQNFRAIGNLAAKGFASTTTSYTFKDNDPNSDFASPLYYRLKMYDLNGTFKYSNTISVNLPSITGTVTISPNPTANDMKAYVVAPADSKAEWRVIDNTGRILLSGNALMKKGSNQLSINLSNLPAGTYFLNLSGNNIDCKTRFQKL
jgi:PQQ-dependent dehydrogenase (s-GDH family)